MCWLQSTTDNCYRIPTTPEKATIEQVRDQLAAGLATAAEIDQHVTNIAGDGLDLQYVDIRTDSWPPKPYILAATG